MSESSTFYLGVNKKHGIMHTHSAGSIINAVDALWRQCNEKKKPKNIQTRPDPLHQHIPQKCLFSTMGEHYIIWFVSSITASLF